jgi:hypothetical protein
MHGRSSLPWLLGLPALLLLVSVAAIPFPAAHAAATVEQGTGTFADSSFVLMPVFAAGGTTIFDVKGSGTVTGALSGTYTFTGILEMDPTGIVHYQLTDKFSVVVDGRPGTLLIFEVGHGSEVTHAFTSQFFIVSGTGDLPELSGQGVLHGTQDPATLLTSGTYSLTYMFR